MKLQTQKGFAIVETLLILVVLALIGGTGYYVWHSKQTADKTLKVADNSVSASTAKPKTDTTKYLTIKEWGVKIPLSQKDAGTYYSTDNGADGIQVYAKEADDLVGPTGVSCKGEYIALMARYANDDPELNSAPDDSVIRTNKKVIGSYTYFMSTHKQYGPDCFQTSKTGDYEADTSTAGSFQGIVTAFTADYSSLQAVK